MAHEAQGAEGVTREGWGRGGGFRIAAGGLGRSEEALPLVLVLAHGTDQAIYGMLSEGQHSDGLVVNGWW